MNVKMELLKRGCKYKNEVIKKAVDDAYEQIVTIVKECGGLLKTPASVNKIPLLAFYESVGGRVITSAATEAVTIHGLRWDDERGLCICTNDTLFDHYFDGENLNKALDDPAYFVEFDKYGPILYSVTVMSIIGGIADYI